MRQIDIEQRRKKVLCSIVEAYIEGATPVGSRNISQRFRWSISPATIRNVMADLEDEGLITHPHTSAGRVPTDKGYRMYVDCLMEPKHLTKEEESLISRLINKGCEDFEALMKSTSKALSMITNLAGVVLTPKLKRSTFKRIELIQLEPKRILTVLMTGSGMVKNSIVEMREELSKTELLRINEFLNEELEGMFLGDIKNYLTRRLLQQRDSFYTFLNKAMGLLSTPGLLKSEENFYFDGTTSVMYYPEFRDIRKARLFLKLFEEKKDLLDIFNEDMEKEGVKVHIGKENACKNIQDYTIITSNYKINKIPIGALGAIGPTRMEYGKVISVVKYLSDALGKVLEGLS